MSLLLPDSSDPEARKEDSEAKRPSESLLIDASSDPVPSEASDYDVEMDDVEPPSAPESSEVRSYDPQEAIEENELIADITEEKCDRPKPSHEESATDLSLQDRSRGERCSDERTSNTSPREQHIRVQRQGDSAAARESPPRPTRPSGGSQSRLPVIMFRTPNGFRYLARFDRGYQFIESSTGVRPVFVSVSKRDELYVRLSSSADLQKVLNHSVWNSSPVMLRQGRIRAAHTKVVISHLEPTATEESIVAIIGSCLSYDVASVRLFLRHNRFTGTACVSFASPEGRIAALALHEILDSDSGRVIAIADYIPATQFAQCFNCFRFGHIRSRCRNARLCRLCGNSAHGNSECPPVAVCQHCHLRHTPGANICAKVRQHRHLRGEMVASRTHRVSRDSERRSDSRQTTPSRQSLRSYASAAQLRCKKCTEHTEETLTLRDRHAEEIRSLRAQHAEEVRSLRASIRRLQSGSRESLEIPRYQILQRPSSSDSSAMPVIQSEPVTSPQHSLDYDSSAAGRSSHSDRVVCAPLERPPDTTAPPPTRSQLKRSIADIERVLSSNEDEVRGVLSAPRTRPLIHRPQARVELSETDSSASDSTDDVPPRPPKMQRTASTRTYHLRPRQLQSTSQPQTSCNKSDRVSHRRRSRYSSPDGISGRRRKRSGSAPHISSPHILLSPGICASTSIADGSHS